MSKTKNDIAWEKLFDDLNIAQTIQEKGYYVIKSSEINIVREARLMTKFDFRSQLPQIFASNKLSILPITRGTYHISEIETFHLFEETETPIIYFEFPNYIESINYNNITSESTAINCAFVSGILNDFLQEERLYPCVNGRMSSSKFSFNINTPNQQQTLQVSNAQIEIDGGYEGLNSLCLIEAKNSISKDFLIRQIYYPFRLWNSKISKPVRSIFLTYSNGIFHFREYSFKDIYHYNSIHLSREAKYRIKEDTITRLTIQEISDAVGITIEPQIPFPQANSFERIINLCELIFNYNGIDKEHVTANYDFDIRQTNYYTDAGRYLGLIEKKKEQKNTYYYLTKKGKDLFKLTLYNRQLEFIRIILEHPVFNRVLNLYFEKQTPLETHEIVLIMKESNLYKIDSDSTFVRRASTIRSWINWILAQIQEQQFS